MKVIFERCWREPAVFIGLLATLALVFVNVIGDDEWGIENIVAVLAPLASALGIRQLVTPTTPGPTQPPPVPNPPA